MFKFLKQKLGLGDARPAPEAPAPGDAAPQAPASSARVPASSAAPAPPATPATPATVESAAAPAAAEAAPSTLATAPARESPAAAPAAQQAGADAARSSVTANAAAADDAAAPRANWLGRLRTGLRKTGSSLAQVFTGTQIDEALYEELETALLMADAGVKATEAVLADLRQRVKDAKASEPARVRELLVDVLAQVLAPLERPLAIGAATPTVVMVVGVNGAGKTTSIGKLTRHLAEADQRVLLAAADTFRAAAREQLAVWADRTRVDIVSQEGGDPSAVTFDAVAAGKARGVDVVIADTAGRLPTQLHLMDELKKIKRVIGKAQDGAPHEVLLVVDGNTGQNALHQVKAFDEALGLTGLIVTKLDGTAKGGVLAAIARERPVPVYFIGIGERLEDLQTFSAREFAQALLG